MVDLANVLRPRPFAQQTTGIVTTYTTGAAGVATRVDVEMGGGVLTDVACVDGYLPEVGDVVLLHIADRRAYVAGKLSHPTVVDPLPPTPPLDTTGTVVFPATAAGTYTDGTWRTDRTDVVQGPDPGSGAAHVGVWCYSDIPAGTLAGATVIEARVWLRRWPNTPAPTVTAGLDLHDLPVPGPPPTALDHTAVPGVDAGFAAWVEVPTDWVTDIIDPASPARGLGVSTPDPADYAAFASLHADPQSGALSITWSR
jgi:hypothetical protein